MGVCSQNSVLVAIQVPISRLGGDDFVSWPHDKHGVYSVRSAYNLVRTSSFFAKRCKNSRGSSSDLDMEAKMWKSVRAIRGGATCAQHGAHAPG
jgi:hypothetical protein